MKWESANTDIALSLFFFLIVSVVPESLLINEVQRLRLPATIKKSSLVKADNDFLYHKSKRTSFFGYDFTNIFNN